uniref:Cytochrome P450 n=1 Tax=Leersia perrieri TaxID=77586 RepID=A0A0D9WSG9_9ORYZ
MADPSHTYLYLGIALVSLFVVLLSKRRRSPEALRLPPGPWQLPVLGSLHHLAGQLPHRVMRDLARRYGPVMMLRLGEVPTVVVSSRDAAREVMKTHDSAFATRPLSATMRVLTKGRDIALAPYGDYWRQVRRIAAMELLSARRVLSFRPIREGEVAAMLRAVEDAAAHRRAVDMQAVLSALVSDTTTRAVMGDRWKDRDVFLREHDRALQLSAGFNLPDLWPSSRLAGCLSGVVREAEKCRDKVFGILDGVIDQHLQKAESGADVDGEDLIDVLLRIRKEGGLQFPLDMDAIKAIIFGIFAAGSETSATTLGWAIAELIRNPKAMQKATAEVRRAFASDGVVSDAAVGELHYLNLGNRETLRLHPPAPLLVPRECREPCQQVLGYDVPQGTQVLVNVWALGRDERYWPNYSPEEFHPERFIDGEAGSMVDFKGFNFELLPFGAGRRMCPGMAFGLANLELPLASLLFHFDWEVPGLADPADLQGRPWASADGATALGLQKLGASKICIPH